MPDRNTATPAWLCSMDRSRHTRSTRAPRHAYREQRVLHHHEAHLSAAVQRVAVQREAWRAVHHADEAQMVREREVVRDAAVLEADAVRTAALEAEAAAPVVEPAPLV